MRFIGGGIFLENYTDMQCSQEDLEKYLDGIPYYTYIKDEDDRLVYVNKQLKVRLNKTEDHIIGHKLDELLGFKFNHADVHSYNNDDSIIIQESVYSLDNKEYCYENGIIKIDREEKSPLYGVIFKNINGTMKY